MRFGLLILAISINADAAAPIQVHGHRGARAVRPENTLPAFEYAIGAGVDALELDMAVTKDDVVVVSHDPVINTTICTGPGRARPIRSMTLAELRQWDCGALKNPKYPKQVPAPGTRIPTLEEVFALADRGRFDFNIETKIFEDRPRYTPSPKKFAELVLAAIRKHKLETRVILQSFDYRTLREMKKLEPRIRLAALDEKGLRGFVPLAKSGGAGIISPEKRLVTAEKVEAAHKAGLQVVPWTANEPAEWEALVRAGADAIISDDPAELIAWLKQRGLR